MGQKSGQKTPNARRRTSNAELPRFNDLTIQRGDAKRSQRPASSFVRDNLSRLRHA
jgi:hypothetical protein